MRELSFEPQLAGAGVGAQRPRQIQRAVGIKTSMLTLFAAVCRPASILTATPHISRGCGRQTSFSFNHYICTRPRPDHGQNTLSLSPARACARARSLSRYYLTTDTSYTHTTDNILHQAQVGTHTPQTHPTPTPQKHPKHTPQTHPTHTTDTL